MSNSSTKVFLLVFSLLLISFHTSGTQGQGAPGAKPDVQSQPESVIESGKFRFYETKQEQGEESYEIRRSSPRRGLIVTAKVNLPFMGEEQKPSLNATLLTNQNLTPGFFQVKGTRLLAVGIDTSITIVGTRAAMIELNPGPSPGGPLSRMRHMDVGATYFTFGGYLPVTMEMMMLRYWLAHGRPTRLSLLPGGEAFIEYRGRDTIRRGRNSVALTRYHLSGSDWGGGWGRQTLWLDSQNRLVAAVNLATDYETNLTAILDGYESNLSFFLRRAVDDGIDRLTQIAARLSPETTKPLVLLGGTLIDGTGRPPIKNSAVLIQGDHIVAAGPKSEVKIPAGAIVADASGKFLVPGLWDMHAHLYQLELGPAYLAVGITTARDMGNEIEFGAALRDAAKQRRGLGPRVLRAGYINGKNEYHNFDVQVGTPAEARAAVQHYKDAGFEQIKIRDHVKLEILKVITAEAHRLGMTVTGHVPEGMNALQAVEAGMDQISHLNFVSTAFFPKLARGDFETELDLESPASKHALELFKERGASVDPTLAVIELMIHPMNMPIESFEPGMMKVAPELIEQLNKKGAPADQAEGIRLVMETLFKMIGAMHRAGIPIVAGTDVGVPGHTLHRELELYVKAGLTPMEAIQAATMVPARLMKLENELGTIEAGKRADILILAGDPLDNISNIRKTKFVVVQGRLFDCSELRKIVGFKP